MMPDVVSVRNSALGARWLRIFSPRREGNKCTAECLKNETQLAIRLHEAHPDVKITVSKPLRTTTNILGSLGWDGGIIFGKTF